MTLSTLPRTICITGLLLFLIGCQSASIQSNARYQVNKPVPKPELTDKPVVEKPVETVKEQDPQHNKIKKPDGTVLKPSDMYKRKPDDIRIVLTFDDGPHATNDPNTSLTMRIAKTLKDGKLNGVQHNIKAAFFMQMAVTYRGGSDAGLKVLSSLNKSGHVMAVHTGSSDGGLRNSGDHIDHIKRLNAGKLDSDMKAALHRLKLIGISSPYVRPVGGNYNRAVLNIYKNNNLKMILWDVDSLDNTVVGNRPRHKDEVIHALGSGITRALRSGKKDLVILFHDINKTTELNLATYIRYIFNHTKKESSRLFNREFRVYYTYEKEMVEYIFNHY